MSRSRAAGLALGFALDRILADPRRGHPVALFGQLAARLEDWLYARSRARGALFTAILVGGSVGLGVALERLTAGRPLLHTATTAAGTWVVLGGSSLGREAAAVHDLLAAGDLPAARRRLTHLVGRDTSTLTEAEIARAAIESVAENTADAVTSPLFWGALLGLPGLLGHRAANTLDAMVGHQDDRYAEYGWASARFDDLVNLGGSRFGALLAVALGPDPGSAARTWRADAGHHPSPNAGPIEAAFAGALGVQLGGVNRYRDRVEDRHTLGDGRSPSRGDMARATTLASRIGVGATVLAALVAATSPAPRPGRRRDR